MTDQHMNLKIQNKQMFFGDMTSKMAHDEQAMSRRSNFINVYN